MPESSITTPLTRLARLVGGVVLMRGHIGHQVLGQLLIADFTYEQVSLAGAGVLVAFAGRRRGVLAQAAVGTAAPALALQGMHARAVARLDRREQALQELAKSLASQRASSPAPAQPPTQEWRAKAERLERICVAIAAENSALRATNDELRRELTALAHASSTLVPVVVEPTTPPPDVPKPVRSRKASRPPTARRGKERKR